MILSTRDETFSAVPYTGRCHGLYARASQVCIGVSPGNGWFSEQRITDLLAWACSHFARVDVLYDSPAMAALSYRSRGYPEGRARQRASRDVKQARARLGRAIEHADSTARVGLHPVDDRDDEDYRCWRRAIREARERHPGFERELRDLVHSVAGGRRHRAGGPPTEDEVEWGVQYLETELPYFLDAPGLLGVPESLMCYRAVPPFAPWIYGLDAVLPAVDGQGFMRIEPIPADTVEGVPEQRTR